MPSPPLAPEDRLLDDAHLDRVTFGDHALQDEVLALFVQQAAGLLRQLAALPPDTAALAHTLKGSARGIGAIAAAECAERLEYAGEGGNERLAALAELQQIMAETMTVIEALRRLN